MAVLTALCGGVSTQAQTLERGQLGGTVYDSTHAAIPSARVTLTNETTGFVHVTWSNEAGLYRCSPIPAGTYTIVVEFSGFLSVTLTDIVISVGASLTLDVTLQPAGQAEAITVAAPASVVDTSTAGVDQVIDQNYLTNLPLLGRDYRDLALLTPSAQVVPGIRGGIRLGGQQSDYTGLVIDGGDAYNNFFGEFFGSIETRNFTIPLDAVQEFQVVTNGFPPEFGRSTGGLLNVVTKSGTNQLQGTGHYFYRDDALASDDALGVPPNIERQQQFGGAVGFPIRPDRQFLFFAADRQLQHGPLFTKFSRNVNGIAVPELGISDLSAFEGPHNQFQNLFSILGRYDTRISDRHTLALRSFFTRNHTDGFTGGRGQSEVQASFGNTELFTNEGGHTVGTLTSVFGTKTNEMKVTYSYETRPRFANDDRLEVQINDTGTFGGRFYLPINGDSEKLQIQDNFVYAFGKHDIKFGGDINAFAARKNLFIAFSRGSYFFNTLEDFVARQPIGFAQGLGLNGVPYEQAATIDSPPRQTGYGLYWQDAWHATPNLTVTYGLRWDGTTNPKATSSTPGQEVYAGIGRDSHLVPPPQQTPDDYEQWGPRVGVAYRLRSTVRPILLRAAWGLYYAQVPLLFIPTGSGLTTILFCFFEPACLPPGGFATIFPNTLRPGDPATAFLGPPGIEYPDPAFKNPRVSNFTSGMEYHFAPNWTASVDYMYSHSDRLRVGGSNSWDRNVVVDHVDEFGRSILVPSPFFGPARQDPTIGSANAVGSFGWENYQQVAFTLRRRFADRYQFFVSYAWSSSNSNGSTERDTDSFFGPQDPFNLELDYGRDQLDITHQFRFAGVAELPFGINLSGTIIARSGYPYPAYTLDDINGDFVSNDRPVVTRGSERFLLERYPASQPNFFSVNFRVAKEFALWGAQRVEVLAELFNLFNNDNLFSNPNISGYVNTSLTDIPKPGDIGPTGVPYRTLDQISPDSVPFSVQLGVRYSF